MRYNTQLIIGCNNGAAQPGIFADKLHVTGVSSKCDAWATMYILNTYGTDKYECLYKEGSTLKGNHYIGPGVYWGTVEYRLTQASGCAGIPFPPPSHFGRPSPAAHPVTCFDLLIFSFVIG